jgi:hypothetical protein
MWACLAGAFDSSSLRLTPAMTPWSIEATLLRIRCVAVFNIPRIALWDLIPASCTMFVLCRNERVAISASVEANVALLADVSVYAGPEWFESARGDTK